MEGIASLLPNTKAAYLKGHRPCQVPVTGCNPAVNWGNMHQGIQGHRERGNKPSYKQLLSPMSLQVADQNGLVSSPYGPEGPI